MTKPKTAAQRRKAAERRKTVARAAPLLETPERAQHAAAIIDRNISTAIGHPRGRLIQAPLDRFAARGSITGRMYSAGLQLKADFEIGLLGGRESSGEFVLGIKGGPDKPWIPDIQIDAMTRFKRAMKALGAHVGAVVVAVCCYERDVAQIAREQSRNRDKVMGVLEDGLKTLADHYRLTGKD